MDFSLSIFLSVLVYGVIVHSFLLKIHKELKSINKTIAQQRRVRIHKHRSK